MHVRTVLTLVAVILLSGVQHAHASAPPVRIWTLGDSITGGFLEPQTQTAIGAYRAPLYRLLVTRGATVDLVGTLSGGPPDIDRDHDGHGGWSAVMLRDQVPIWYPAVRPDIVLLDAGVNDLILAWQQGRSLAMAADEGADADLAILDLIAARTPAPPVLVMAVGHTTGQFGPDFDRQVDRLNVRLAAGIQDRQRRGQRVQMLDARLPPTELQDGLHPNDAGNAHMAAVWYAALVPLLDATTAQCAMPPPLNVITTPDGPGILNVRVVPLRTGDRVQSITFGQLQNAQIDPPTIDAHGGASFAVRRVSPGAFMAPFVVAHDCGGWPSFVGAGGS